MKMRKKPAVILLVVLAMLTGCYSQNPSMKKDEPHIIKPTPIQNDKILLVTGEFAPYTSEKLTDDGFSTQMLQAVFQEMGMACEIRFYPWIRAEEMVQKGEAWGAFPYIYTEKRANDYLVSEPIHKASLKYFYLKGNKKITNEVLGFRTISDFRNIILGGANGYWYGTREELKKQGLNNVEWADDTSGLVKMLYNQRIDVFIEDDLVGLSTIKKIYPQETDRFATLDKAATSMDYIVIVSKNYPNSTEILDKFNKVLTKLKARGTLEKISESRQKN